jgi:hypothetical protein
LRTCARGVRGRAAAGLHHFAARRFHELNPQAEPAMGWHIEVIAAALTAVQQGKIRRLIINLPPGHLKILDGLGRFPAWCLCHVPVGLASSSAMLVMYECGIALKQSRARSAGRARPAAGGSTRVASPRLFNLGFSTIAPRHLSLSVRRSGTESS